MSSAKARKKGRGRTQRYTTFSMIDVSKDGVIDKSDLIEMLRSLGKDPEDGYLEEMLNQSQGSLNFTMFLTMFGEKMMGCDPEETILNAFQCFDQESTGLINEDQLRELMTTMGDRWTHEKVDELFHGAPINEGDFNYKAFTRMIMHGQEDDEENNATA